MAAHLKEGIRRHASRRERRRLVGVAYRLNAFGFMTHPLLHEAVERGDGRPYLRNFSFLDRRAGIQWVKENIAKFGGDGKTSRFSANRPVPPASCPRCSSPMNHGLFQKAIMQSGAGLGYFNARQDTLEQARAIPARTVLEAAESLLFHRTADVKMTGR